MPDSPPALVSSDQRSPQSAGAVSAVTTQPAGTTKAQWIRRLRAIGSVRSNGERRSPRERARLFRRVVAIAVFVVIMVGAAGLLIGIALSQENPSWWQTIDAGDPKVVQSARMLENNFATLMTKVRGGGIGSAGQGAASKPVINAPMSIGEAPKPVPPVASVPANTQFTIALKAEDANAWLNARLPKWLENEAAEKGKSAFKWPSALGQLQVDFDNNRIYLAASVTQAGQSQVLTATIEPDLREDGSLWMPARWLGVGKLKMPAGWMLGSNAGTGAPRAMENVPPEIAKLPQTRDVLTVLRGRLPAMRNATFKIGDGRRVRLVGLEAKDGRLLITCETVKN